MVMYEAMTCQTGAVWHFFLNLFLNQSIGNMILITGSQINESILKNTQVKWCFLKITKRYFLNYSNMLIGFILQGTNHLNTKKIILETKMDFLALYQSNTDNLLLIKKLEYEVTRNYEVLSYGLKTFTENITLHYCDYKYTE